MVQKSKTVIELEKLRSRVLLKFANLFKLLKLLKFVFMIFVIKLILYLKCIFYKILAILFLLNIYIS